jgi:hypothetical protein
MHLAFLGFECRNEEEPAMKKSPLRPGFEAGGLCWWRTVGRWNHAWVWLVALFAVLALSRDVLAAERGAIGGALDVGRGELGFVGDLRAGISAWYRFKPALAIGVSASALYVDNGDDGGETVIDGGTLVEAFADGRLFPSSFVGGFGRVSAGLANVSISRYSGGSHRLKPALELEMGPELRIFFEPQHDSRATLFVRARATFSLIPRDEDVERASSAFFGYGFALGFEG